MNAVWNSYGQLCGCPEIFKKSCKFFCRGLDIRVAQIMHAGIRCSSHSCDLFMMGVEPLWVQMVTEGIGKDQPTGGVLLGGVYPVLPQITGL